MASRPSARLDLSRHRDYGDLLSTTLRVFTGHSAVFLTAALLVVTPATLIVDGVWGRALADGIEADPPIAAAAVSGALRVFVILPLVTAMNIVIVQALARGAVPTVGAALRAALRRFAPVVAAVTLYLLGVLAGFVLLIAPGIWLAVRWYFAAQAVMADGLGPVAALRRSAELVSGAWWRAFGLLLGTGLLFGLGGSIAIEVLGALGSSAVYVAGLIIVEAVTVSLTAIFGALLFYDLRARRQLPWQGAGTVDPEAPERPVGEEP